MVADAGASLVVPLALRGAPLRTPASRTTVAPPPVPTGIPEVTPRPASRNVSLSRMARCGGLFSQPVTTWVALSSGVPAQAMASPTLYVPFAGIQPVARARLTSVLPAGETWSKNDSATIASLKPCAACEKLAVSL